MQVIENKADSLVAVSSSQAFQLTKSGRKQEHFSAASTSETSPSPSRLKRHLHVASEVIVRDGTIITSSSPISMALAGHSMWVSCTDGSLEVRNARTAELVKRLVEPSSHAVEKTNCNGLSNIAHTNTHVFGNVITNYTQTSNIALVNEIPHRVITVIHATNYSTFDSKVDESKDMRMQVWLGDNHGMIEVCDGENFKHLCSFAAHTGSVTCMCDFAGMLYSGSCSVINESKTESREHHVLSNNGSDGGVYSNKNNTKLGSVADDLAEGILQ